MLTAREYTDNFPNSASMRAMAIMGYKNKKNVWSKEVDGVQVELLLPYLATSPSHFQRYCIGWIKDTGCLMAYKGAMNQLLNYKEEENEPDASLFLHVYYNKPYDIDRYSLMPVADRLTAFLMAFDKD